LGKTAGVIFIYFVR